MGILRKEQVALLTDYDSNSAYALAYHRLFANIRFNWENDQRQLIVLLAVPAPYPGHEAAAANLAIAAAQNGTPTILVDAGRLTPGLQQRFGIKQAIGLSDLLSEGAIHTQHVHSCLSETFIPGLLVLSAGSVQASGSHPGLLPVARLNDVVLALRQVLSERDSRPGLVVFHAPPVLTHIDAVQIGGLVDQTFLLVAAGHTTRTQAKRAQEQLERAHAKLAGVIMLDI